jgi:hypothetical protein
MLQLVGVFLVSNGYLLARIRFNQSSNRVLEDSLSCLPGNIFASLDIIYYKLSYVLKSIFNRLDIIYHRLLYIQMCPALQVFTLYIVADMKNHSINYILPS